MHRVQDWWVGPNFGVRPKVKENYLRLAVEEMCACVVFTNKQLRSHGCNGSDFTATINYANLKTAMPSEIIEIKAFKKKSSFS